MAGLLLAGSCSAATLPFYDDFENGLANWLPGGSWGLDHGALCLAGARRDR